MLLLAGPPMLSWTCSSLGSAFRGDGSTFIELPLMLQRPGLPEGSPIRLHSRVSFDRVSSLLSLESAVPFWGLSPPARTPVRKLPVLGYPSGASPCHQEPGTLSERWRAFYQSPM